MKPGTRKRYPNWIEPAYLQENRPGLKHTEPRICDRIVWHLRDRPRRTCIQAGAHLGIWPAKLATRFNMVHAFEPIAYLYAAALDAITARNVELHPYALSSTSGQLRVSQAAKRYSGSGTVTVSPSKGDLVRAYALDDLPELTEHCDAIVLDVEGHEAEILRGAAAMIERCRPLICVEENARSLRHRAPLAPFLEQIGYRLVERHRDDFIFTPGEWAPVW